MATNDDFDFPQTSVLPAQRTAPVYPLFNKEKWLAEQGAGAGFRDWTNPTNQVQRAEFSKSFPRWIDSSTIPEADRCVRVVIKPGETVSLPKVWDAAILRMHGGKIVGGLMPNLRPCGAGPLTLTDGLLHLEADPSGPEAA